ncbi:hypothetical protein A2Z33_03945 [Candidatus Gottesmanbacteria bacterium RBG_16_52_11]|uniref:Uncharacterized protein n=1 Tax=Candidatus Gottesmanbacteria bacterium RBG_16_52_11 TaxID=1798374 RepID=A0A1F5YW02_9BACT|nr:MAG: hypothetical protein A2Z33_03945 [Candidatus Gottesmanbacteria bacterium RBG_16_52_11]
MDELKQKIKNTGLFEDDDKVEILASLDALTLSDLKELESIIDEFDAKQAEIQTEFNDKVMTELDNIDKDAKDEDRDRTHHATDAIRAGLTTVLSA